MAEPQTMSLSLPGMKKPLKVPKWAPVAGAGVVGLGAFLLLRGKGSTASSAAPADSGLAPTSPVTPVTPAEPIPTEIPVPNPVVPTFPAPIPIVDTSGDSGTSYDSVSAVSAADAPTLATLESQIQGAGFAVMREQYTAAGIGASGVTAKYDDHLAKSGGAGNLEVPAGPQSSKVDLGDTALKGAGLAAMRDQYTAAGVGASGTKAPAPIVKVDTSKYTVTPAAGKGPGAKIVAKPETVTQQVQGAGWAVMREQAAGITSKVVVTPAAGKGPGAKATTVPTSAASFLASKGIKVAGR